MRLAKGRASSWSCAHGVGRWNDDCGCVTGGEEGWNQAWRAPLRSALEVLREASVEIYDRLGSASLRDPWAARDAYVEVVIGRRSLEDFLWEHSSGPTGPEETQRLGTLLELQRYTLALFTSCAWFFADIGGIETVQILRYAGRVVELMRTLEQPVPDQAFMSALEQAKSNEPEKGTGADIFSALSR